jgi:acetyl-CoA carboxylase carboxyl transferase subunit beta
MPIKLPSFRQRREAYPPDLWTKCPSCEEMLFNRQLDKVRRVCPNCGHHFRLSAAARLDLLLDAGSFEEHDEGLQSVDPLDFVDQKPYPERVAAAQAATGLRDAAMWGFGRIEGRMVAICVMDFSFMGGSMGSVVGEKVTRAAEAALDARVPLIIVSASGGARMQEGTLALMQLAKTVGALERLRAEGVPFVSILTDPTTGGVFASFAALGDVNLAEPNALIGFAGARVTASTIAAELPPGFQRSEFLFEHGFLDRVVHRSELRAEVSSLLRYLVPASFEEPPSEALSVPAFRPLSFLSALADRVMPDLEPEEPPPNGPRPAAKAAPSNVPAPSSAPPTSGAPASSLASGTSREPAMDRSASRNGPAPGGPSPAAGTVKPEAAAEGAAQEATAPDDGVAVSATHDREPRDG